jgi:hypothetical protein
MNERIRELWDKAAKQESDPSWEGQTKFMENFALLIVGEICELIRKNEYNLLPSKMHRMSADAEEQMIKKHFGVEE